MSRVFFRVGECEPCKQGKKCPCKYACNEQTCPDKRVGALIEKAVPWTQVQEFDATVRNYGTDVGKWTTMTPGTASVTYSIKWNNFYTSWRVWFDVEAEPGFFDMSVLGQKFITGSKLIQYEQKVAEYKELWREGTENLKIHTTAKGEAPAPPIDLPKITEEASKAAADAAARAAEIAKWTAIGIALAGVAFAGLLLYPVVAPALGLAVSRARAA